MVRPDSSRDAAGRWCADRAIGTDEAVARLAGRQICGDFRKEFAEELQYADSAAATCPVTMGGAGNIDLLYRLAQAVEAREVVETGVAYGWSSLALLLSLAQRAGSRLVSTDMPYPGMENEKYVGCVVPPRLRGGWELIRRADRDALPGVLKKLGAIDMSHYDSDKSYAGRMWAYDRLWKHTRPGGYLVSDDIGDNAAFADFSARVGAEPVVVGFSDGNAPGKYAGVLRKPDDC